MRSVKSQIRAFQSGTAGIEDPTAGIVSERAWLYSGDDRGHRFGAAPEGCIKVRGDGYSTAHTGNCAADIEEAPEEVLIRAAGLDRVEAEIVRRRARHESVAAIAMVLGCSERTVQRRLILIAAKAAGYIEAVRGMG